MEDEDFLDGCDIDYAEHAISEEEQELFPLFPNGKDEALEAQWKELFA